MRHQFSLFGLGVARSHYRPYAAAMFLTELTRRRAIDYGRAEAMLCSMP
jgi:hypothetical protein